MGPRFFRANFFKDFPLKFNGKTKSACTLRNLPFFWLGKFYVKARKRVLSSVCRWINHLCVHFYFTWAPFRPKLKGDLVQGSKKHFCALFGQEIVAIKRRPFFKQCSMNTLHWASRGCEQRNGRNATMQHSELWKLRRSTALRSVKTESVLCSAELQTCSQHLKMSLVEKRCFFGLFGFFKLFFIQSGFKVSHWLWFLFLKKNRSS